MRLSELKAEHCSAFYLSELKVFIDNKDKMIFIEFNRMDYYMKKTILSLIISSCLIGTVFAANTNNTTTSTNAGADKALPLIVKISHTDKANSIKGKSLIRFKEMLEAKFPGKVKVELYDNASLYKDSEEIEAVQLGTVNIIAPEVSSVENQTNIKELQLFDLPFLITNTNDFKKINYGKSSQDLLSIYNDKNKSTLGLGFLSEGYRIIASNKAIKSPDELKNKNIAVASLGINQQTYQAFGFKDAVKTDENNIPYLLKADRINMADISLNRFKDLGLNNQFKFVTETNHAYDADMILVNKRWFNNLPVDIKQGIMDTTKDVIQYNIELADKDYISNKEDLKKNGVSFYTWTDNEKEIFKKLVIPVHTSFLNNINKNLLLEVYQEIKNN